MTNSGGFDKNGLDNIGIHWLQYLSMTCISMLIFFIALDKANPDFHNIILRLLFKIQCSNFNCNGVEISWYEIDYKDSLFKSSLLIFFPVIEKAAKAPLAATGGIPIPGKVLEPHNNKFFMGVLLPGNNPLDADKAGP